MRGKAPVLLVFTIAVAGSMVGLAGFGAAWGAEPPQTEAAQDQLERSGAQNNPNADAPVEGPVSSGESDIVGLIADGLGSMVDLGAAAILLPVTLIELGFPAWFAVPIGSLVYILVGVSLIEFATNREWT